MKYDNHDTIENTEDGQVMVSEISGSGEGKTEVAVAFAVALASFHA